MEVMHIFTMKNLFFLMKVVEGERSINQQYDQIMESFEKIKYLLTT